MAIVNLTTIKNWFKTGLKPTQVQFWNTWDSFFHKNEQIPISSITDLQTILNSKTDAQGLMTVSQVKEIIAQLSIIDVSIPNSPVGQMVFGEHTGVNEGAFFFGRIISSPGTWSQLSDVNLKIIYRN